MILCVLTLARPGNCRAQDAGAPMEAQPIEARTDLVRLDVSVLDRHGHFVAGLAQDNFRVMDDSVERPIAFFAPVDSPARMLVMIETGPAVYLIHDEHLAAAYALVQGLDPADQVALVSYSDKPHRILDFTTSKPAFLSALGSLQYMLGMGNLNFYDSLSEVVGEIAPKEGKTAVVLLTTGIDTSPASHWAPLVETLRRTDVVIFSVALGGILREEENPKAKRKKQPAKPEASAEDFDSLDGLTGFPRADRALQSLAQITGGRVYFPQSDKDFAPIYREIAATLRHQYVLGIAPVRDGRYHTLTVEVYPRGEQDRKQRSPKMNYRIFARQGYVAPAN